MLKEGCHIITVSTTTSTNVNTYIITHNSGFRGTQLCLFALLFQSLFTVDVYVLFWDGIVLTFIKDISQ